MRLQTLLALNNTKFSTSLRNDIAGSLNSKVLHPSGKNQFGILVTGNSFIVESLEDFSLILVQKKFYNFLHVLPPRYEKRPLPKKSPRLKEKSKTSFRSLDVSKIRPLLDEKNVEVRTLRFKGKVWKRITLRLLVEVAQGVPSSVSIPIPDRGIGSRSRGKTRVHTVTAGNALPWLASSSSPSRNSRPPPPSLRPNCTLTPTSRRRCGID